MVDKPELNEMHQALMTILDLAATDSGLLLMAYSPGGGVTYPAVIAAETGEILALLCIPPVLYDPTKVH